MILADTSVWIRAARRRDHYAEILFAELDRARLVGHELVFGEMLMGDRGGRAWWLEQLTVIPWLVRRAHAEVAALVRRHQLHGRGIDWTDAHLLASACHHGHQLWTADERLAAIACELGCGWPPTR